MGLESRFIEQDTVVGKVARYTEEATMKVTDYVVRTDTTDGAFDLKLPPVSEAKGRIYSIVQETSNNNLVVKDQGDSQLWSDKTITEADGNLVVYSDGFRWCILEFNAT